MANPTLENLSDQHDQKGLVLHVAGIRIGDAVVLGAERAASIADVPVDASADAAENAAALNAILTVLRDQGLIADPA